MLPADLLAIALRGLSFLAMAQAAGAALFVLQFGGQLEAARESIRRHAHWCVGAGLLLVPAQYAMEAGRMAGRMTGVVDLELQRFVLGGPAPRVAALRLLGLVLLAAALRYPTRRAGAGMATATGVAALAGSFALIGHTSGSPQRWLLAPLLALHLLIVCYWFGALRPLVLVVRGESPATAARVVACFSRTATWVVPALLLSGAVIAASLLPDLDALASAYGGGLLAKSAAFSLLMLLAALNKWRLAPALESGGLSARQRFVRSIQAEWLVIAIVLLGTAALTMLASP